MGGFFKCGVRNRDIMDCSKLLEFNSSRNRQRVCICIAFGLIAFSSKLAFAQGLLKTHCAKCHGEVEPEGEFPLSVSHGEIRQILHSVEGISIGRAAKENRTLT